MNPIHDETDAPFRAFPNLNKASLECVTRSRVRLWEFADQHLPEDTFDTRIIRALAQTRVIGPKEALESFEFYTRVKRRMRAPSMADLCCGHGLVGLLFGAMERSVERVTLMDVRRTEGSKAILDAVISVAPWLEPKLTWIECESEEMVNHLEPGTSITGVHACGKLTDRCLDIARDIGGPVAVMPCCYGPNQTRGPEVLKRMLDPWVVTDVDRTYRLESYGFKVDWQFIPKLITPRNRIILGLPRGRSATENTEEHGG
jgi:hypothetical protein